MSHTDPATGVRCTGSGIVVDDGTAISIDLAEVGDVIVYDRPTSVPGACPACGTCPPGRPRADGTLRRHPGPERGPDRPLVLRVAEGPDRLMAVRPDFVMLGVRDPDGTFSIYASTELRRADLVAHREAPLGVILALGGDVSKIPPSRFELDAELGSYAEGHGPSYAAALLDLMRTWTPPDATRALLDEVAALGSAEPSPE